jgi:hypothetical protein
VDRLCLSPKSGSRTAPATFKVDGHKLAQQASPQLGSRALRDQIIIDAGRLVTVPGFLEPPMSLFEPVG